MRNRAIVWTLAGTGLRVSKALLLDRERFDAFFGNWNGQQAPVYLPRQPKKKRRATYSPDGQSLPDGRSSGVGNQTGQLYQSPRLQTPFPGQIANAGMDLRDLQSIARHSDPRTTVQAYIGPAGSKRLARLIRQATEE